MKTLIYVIQQLPLPKIKNIESTVNCQLSWYMTSYYLLVNGTRKFHASYLAEFQLTCIVDYCKNCTNSTIKSEDSTYFNMAETMRQTVASILKSIERYNPANLQTLERYVELQSRENTYDLEANLAVLKLYQFNPEKFNPDITCQILLKALTNFPHTDFTLCKCLLLESVVENETISQIKYLADILEQCDFAQFWNRVHQMPELCNRISSFHDSIRKFVCHVVGITFQTIEKNNLANLLGGIDDVTLKHWVKKYGWKDDGNLIFIANQDENIKTKNITEKIEFDHLAPLMAIL